MHDDLGGLQFGQAATGVIGHVNANVERVRIADAGRVQINGHIRLRHDLLEDDPSVRLGAVAARLPREQPVQIAPIEEPALVPIVTCGRASVSLDLDVSPYGRSRGLPSMFATGTVTTVPRSVSTFSVWRTRKMSGTPLSSLP